MLNLKALKEAAEALHNAIRNAGTTPMSWSEYASIRSAYSSATEDPSTILSLIERCEELEGALEPFARATDVINIGYRVTEDDLRNAKAALSKADATS